MQISQEVTVVKQGDLNKHLLPVEISWLVQLLGLQSDKTYKISYRSCITDRVDIKSLHTHPFSNASFNFLI